MPQGKQMLRVNEAFSAKITIIKINNKKLFNIWPQIHARDPSRALVMY